MTNFAKSFSVLLLCASVFISNLSDALEPEQLYTSQPTVTPSMANVGKWPVGVKTLEVINPKQLDASDFVSLKDRPLTLEVWYPSSGSNSKLASYEDVVRGGKAFSLLGAAYRDAPVAESTETFPLIVLSHGYTGYRSIMFYLGEHLASHGYVVAAIDHTDSRNKDIDFTKNPGAGFMSTLLNRARDQQFVLEHFAASNSNVSKRTNTDKASVIGYSMGGYGAVNTVGGCYEFTDKVLSGFGVPAAVIPAMLTAFNTCAAGRNEADPRWKAMMAFAPWGGEPNIHKAESLAKINVPTLYVGGEKDDIVGYENGVKRLFELTSVNDNYLMVYENARHNIAAHPAPKIAYDDDLTIGHYFEPSWKIETINRINKHMALSFLNCYVKQDKAGCAMLPTTEDITQVKQVDGKLSPAWPGFSERWGTGIKMYKK